MRGPFVLSALAFGLLASMPVLATDPPPEPPKNQRPLKVTTVQQALALPASVNAVEVRFYDLVDKDEKALTAILEAFARHRGIRRLIFQLPNSKRVTTKHLDLLKEIKSLESLELVDQRAFKSPETFKQVAAIQGLRHLKMSFG